QGSHDRRNAAFGGGEDDFVMGFACEEEARRVLEVLPKRFGKYGLTLHPDKTRLVPFVRPGPSRRGAHPSNSGTDFRAKRCQNYAQGTRLTGAAPVMVLRAPAQNAGKPGTPRCDPANYSWNGRAAGAGRNKASPPGPVFRWGDGGGKRFPLHYGCRRGPHNPTSAGVNCLSCWSADPSGCVRRGGLVQRWCRRPTTLEEEPMLTRANH